MPQDQFEYEVMRELHEDTTEAWDEDWRVQCGTADEARGDYDHDVQRQRELDDETTT